MPPRCPTRPVPRSSGTDRYCSVRTRRGQRAQLDPHHRGKGVLRLPPLLRRKSFYDKTWRPGERGVAFGSVSGHQLRYPAFGHAIERSSLGLRQPLDLDRRDDHAGLRHYPRSPAQSLRCLDPPVSHVLNQHTSRSTGRTPLHCPLLAISSARARAAPSCSGAKVSHRAQSSPLQWVSPIAATVESTP